MIFPIESKELLKDKDSSKIESSRADNDATNTTQQNLLTE